MRTRLLIAALLIGAVSVAQPTDKEFEDKMMMKGLEKKYSWSFQNVFADIKYSGLSELLIIPEKEYDYLFYAYSGQEEPDTVVFTDKGAMANIFAITLEPRVNLWSNYSKAFFVKAPLELGFSMTINSGTITYRKLGMFNINFPALVGFGVGLNSSYQNIAKRGFALSAGYQFMMTPVIGGQTKLFTEVYTNNEYVPVDEPFKVRRTFGFPIVQLDYYSRKDGSAPLINGWSLTFCPYGNIYFKVAKTFVLTKK